MSSTLDLTRQLVSRASVSPVDGGCQELLIARLKPLGFVVERMRFGEVDNFWALRRGGQGPVLCFAGHTDVVPPGPLEQWQSDPFQPVVRDGKLFGRGAADMKSGLAAMVTATEEFVAAHAQFDGSIAFLITSDEEGPSVDGTRRVVEVLRERGQRIDYCLVGEPSSLQVFGDTIRIGRRGSLSGRLTVHGVQGHVAYPDRADNPIHRLAPALVELTTRVWDSGSEHFQPTTFQVSNLNAGTGAPNVIPGELKARFNLRWSTAQTLEGLKKTITAILDRHQLRYSLEWFVSGMPYYSPPGKLAAAAVAAVREISGRTPELSTGGGTSDGRFIAPMGAEVIELGIVNETIHMIDECCRIEELETLQRVYQAVLTRLL
ncbi:MAG: succinyl-diaminopimelate desuccinylase [Steroidobacteraceae bacterium]|nr:succinyl-diaminopimelate desuccinylase [Steroidobacteraceae bacterium]